MTKAKRLVHDTRRLINPQEKSTHEKEIPNAMAKPKPKKKLARKSAKHSASAAPKKRRRPKRSLLSTISPRKKTAGDRESIRRGKEPSRTPATELRIYAKSRSGRSVHSLELGDETVIQYRFRFQKKKSEYLPVEESYYQYALPLLQKAYRALRAYLRYIKDPIYRFRFEVEGLSFVQYADGSDHTYPFYLAVFYDPIDKRPYTETFNDAFWRYESRYLSYSDSEKEGSNFAQLIQVTSAAIYVEKSVSTSAKTRRSLKKAAKISYGRYRNS